MDEQNSRGDDKLRKVLKNLPQAKAREDFQQRLHRRLEERKAVQNARRFVWFPLRLPAYAYSLLAVLTVGLVAYFALFRQGYPSFEGQSPPPTIQGRSTNGAGEESLSQKSMHDGEGANRQGDMQSSPPKTGESKDRGTNARSDKKASVISTEAGRRETPVQPLMKTSPMIQGRAKETPTATEELKASPENVPVPPPVHRGIHSLSPRMKAVPQMQGEESTIISIDSLAKKDSLRADSLRQLKHKPGGKK